jgi:hypothetical protein
VSGEDEGAHLPEIEIDATIGQVSHAEHLAAVEAHMAKARPAISVLLTRARLLVRNGVDLRHPERVSDFVADQLRDAVDQAMVHECGCAGAQGSAVAALLAGMTAEFAMLLEGREQ